MPEKKLNKVLKIFLIFIGVIGLMIAVYFLPPMHDRLSWRITNLRASIFYFFNPPDEVSFSPAQQDEMEVIVRQTQTAMAPTPTQTLEPSITPTNFVSSTPTVTPSPTPTPTPIPDSVRLRGVVHEFEQFNNCGPATLAMALSYWGWEGDQNDTAAYLKPVQEDRNVMPYEMTDYVRTQTSFNAIVRSGGDLEIIKKFIAAGFPVIIEKGFQEEVEQKAWMGHYGVITAYDDDKDAFLIQDPYVGEDYSNLYEKVQRHWRSFNYVYIVIYPPEREQEVFSILGPHVDETYNYQHAAQKAIEETYELEGRELFFAWFNYGTSLTNLGDYYGAAKAYDQAYEIYADLYPKPWRITWYQTGPYFAYYYTGRYQDVIDLADITISYVSNQPAIEESWVWRGRARVALGDIDGAIEDFREALKWHPGWWVAEAELRNLGIEP
jgi:hypothetical protein